MRRREGCRRRLMALGGPILLACLAQGDPARIVVLAQTDGAPFTSNLRSATLDPVTLDALSASLGASPAEGKAIQLLYARHAFAPVWSDGAAVAVPEARVAVHLLQHASAHGLDPEDYLVGPWALAGRAPPEPSLADDRREAETDVALSLGVLRFMRHLHVGRVDPRELGLRISTRDEPHDLVETLDRALKSGRLSGVPSNLAPPFPVYGQLVDALERYRTLSTRQIPALRPLGRALHPGDEYPDAPALAMRLALEGDLAEADVRVASADHYDEVLAAGVRRFQERHGFAADGVVGSRTLAALRAPLATRVRQLELALERLRWLPDLGYRRTIVVNIPMFQLWAWDERPLGSLPPIAMDIIVGRARRTRTPVFVESMQELIFRPYWNVPRSILRNELLPAMRADPAYLSTHHFEVVSGEGNDAQPVEVDADALERGTGRLRLRQRPGVANALGPVKFLFPNVEGVYMHGTPTPGLFKRDRRDFSHGCIRVADPAALAVWVLGRTPGWTATRVAEAMTSGPLSQSVTLAERIDVVLYYMTAYVRPEDGAVRFAEDIYGHDAALERALARSTALP